MFSLEEEAGSNPWPTKCEPHFLCCSGRSIEEKGDLPKQMKEVSRDPRCAGRSPPKHPPFATTNLVNTVHPPRPPKLSAEQKEKKTASAPTAGVRTSTSGAPLRPWSVWDLVSVERLRVPRRTVQRGVQGLTVGVFTAVEEPAPE